MKLMAKNAEDRYQSAWGLKIDLEECWEQWQQKAAIALFPLSKNDISDRFQIPQKLYGREREIQALLTAFDRVTHPNLKSKSDKSSSKKSNAELILVTGYSGIGKSALVRELYKPITAKRGCFISGKFDQFQRNIPYSALAGALAGFVKQLLGEPQAILQKWREIILEALGTNGQVIIDIIPDLELIIGVQPTVSELGAPELGAPELGAPELGAIEAQNRFNLVFQRFIQVLCRPEHPLVIFLDDMQWADMATLNLLERLLGESQISYLLTILAYRDNEVSADHPLTIAIAQLQRKDLNVEQITLSTLPLEQIEQLIADTLQRELSTVKELAKLVRQKTEGNPFFTNQFLKILDSEKLLNFNYRFNQWEWNLNQIERMGFTDNVVELVVLQLQKMPESVQKVLAIGAYLGTNFDLKTLSLVQNQTQSDIFIDLKLALELGFIVARSPLDRNLLIQNYQFGHDRIQQAAYSLISDRDRTHYEIGKLLWQLAEDAEVPKTQIEEQIFTLVNHLNYGIEFIITAQITAQNEGDRLAQLNLVACRKAKDATAYQTASEYAAIGINLLGTDAWQRQYDLTLNLYELATEVASLNGKFAQMEEWFNAVIDHAQTPIAQVNVYDVKIRSLTSRSQPLEAIAVGRSILVELGVQFPDIPSPSDTQIAVREIDSLITSIRSDSTSDYSEDSSRRVIADLFELPLMTDRENLAKIQILTSIFAPCYQIASPFFSLVVALQVNLAIQYGNSPSSAFSYACFAFILCNFFQDVNSGSQYSQLAYRLANINKSIRCHAFFAICYYLTHRYAHLRESQPIAQTAYEVGLETGNLEYAGYSIYTFYASLFWCGQSLEDLEPQLLTYRQLTFNLNQLHSSNMFGLLWESVLYLMGRSQIELSFNQPPMITDNLVLGFSSCQLEAMVHYFIGDNISENISEKRIEATSQAIAYTNQAKAYLAGGAGTISEGEFYFYDSLILLKANSQLNLNLNLNLELNLDIEARIQANQAKLLHWAEYAPMNFLHKWQLVEAERFRVKENKLEALELYDRAIAGAKAQGYKQEEALAMELAADFYLNWHKEKIAHTYLVEAHYCYLHWGAIAKVINLETQYPHLFPQKRFAVNSSASPKTTGNTTSADLDLSSIMKSSQAIAGEIVLEDLLQTSMKILLENAGAQIGYLLLPNASIKDLGAELDPDLSIELVEFSIAIYNDGKIATIYPQQLINQVLPKSILHYVARTQESVVIENAAELNIFSHDPYILSVKPLSILCYPLMNQGYLVGLVYLENQVTTAAFTKNRIEFLQLLSGQAAIAITNAQLYAEKVNYSHTLEQKVAERTAELVFANEKLSKLATLDGLTKIANRRCFDTYLESQWKQHIRDREPLALIIIDIDYFKLYNDQYGHQDGDECLIRVTQALAQVLQRPIDLIARYGGEEFAAILPNTNLEGAFLVAESMRSKISSFQIPHARSKLNQFLTLSLGVAVINPNNDNSLEELISMADTALYRAKNQGRDRSIAYTA